jgi:hypothetical protein
MTSQGDLLHVVERIKEIVYNQYSKYQKDITTAHHSIKFQHKPAAILFLPPRIHKIITPIVIELVQ